MSSYAGSTFPFLDESRRTYPDSSSARDAQAQSDVLVSGQQQMKWLYPLRNAYTPYDAHASSPESCNRNDTSTMHCYGSPQPTDSQFYMLSPSPEPSAIACAVSAANVALRLARDVRDRIPHYDTGNSSSLFLSLNPSLSCHRPPQEQVEFVKFDVYPSVKPFACSYPNCTRAFKRPEHLKRHEKSHTGVRDYKCDVEKCGKLFTRRDNLKQHRKTHMKVTGRNPYVPNLK